MNKILIVLVAIALGGGVYWYVTQVPAQEDIVINTQGLSQQKVTTTQTTSKTNTEPTNTQGQTTALDPATHKRQFFWTVPVNKTVYATDNRFSLRLSKSVDLVNGQMESEVTVVTPEKTQAIAIGLPHAMKISIPVEGSTFNIEVCMVGQTEAHPNGEASFAISFGSEPTLCPNLFQGESPTDPKFNP